MTVERLPAAIQEEKTGEKKHSKTWWYDFIFAERRIREPAKTRSKTIAILAEKRRRRELEEGFNALGGKRQDRIRPIHELGATYLEEYKVLNPKSASFAAYAIGHVSRILGGLMAVDVSDTTVVGYRVDRLKELAAPKSINEEVSFLLRLLPVEQAGVIRAQLRRDKRLKLRLGKPVGKAYSPDEKRALIEAAKNAPRSRAIYLGTMLALHGGLRDEEIRTLQWNRMNLTTRIVTVGESKTDAGTGRTIPMNDDLFAAAIEYAKWYTGRFGASQPEWYVFPFGRPRPTDPTRPQTSLKTAWRNVRRKSTVQGRFHDNRHTFVTDLAEGGASDQEIQDLAGQVSAKMGKHYSHIRIQAKRRAVAALATKTPATETVSGTQEQSPDCRAVPQEVPQVLLSESGSTVN